MTLRNCFLDIRNCPICPNFRVSYREVQIVLYVFEKGYEHTLIPSYRFIELVISFDVKNIRIVHPERAECFLFTVSVSYHNFSLQL